MYKGCPHCPGAYTQNSHLTDPTTSQSCPPKSPIYLYNIQNLVIFPEHLGWLRGGGERREAEREICCFLKDKMSKPQKQELGQGEMTKPTVCCVQQPLDPCSRCPTLCSSLCGACGAGGGMHTSEIAGWAEEGSTAGPFMNPPGSPTSERQRSSEC